MRSFSAFLRGRFLIRERLIGFPLRGIGRRTFKFHSFLGWTKKGQLQEPQTRG